MLPYVMRLQGVDDVFAVEQRSHSAWCMFDLERTI